MVFAFKKKRSGAITAERGGAITTGVPAAPDNNLRVKRSGTFPRIRSKTSVTTSPVKRSQVVTPPTATSSLPNAQPLRRSLTEQYRVEEGDDNALEESFEIIPDIMPTPRVKKALFLDPLPTSRSMPQNTNIETSSLPRPPSVPAGSQTGPLKKILRHPLRRGTSAPMNSLRGPSPGPIDVDELMRADEEDESVHKNTEQQRRSPTVLHHIPSLRNTFAVEIAEEKKDEDDDDDGDDDLDTAINVNIAAATAATNWQSLPPNQPEQPVAETVALRSTQPEQTGVVKTVAAKEEEDSGEEEKEASGSDRTGTSNSSSSGTGTSSSVKEESDENEDDEHTFDNSTIPTQADLLLSQTAPSSRGYPTHIGNGTQLPPQCDTMHALGQQQQQRFQDLSNKVLNSPRTQKLLNAVSAQLNCSPANKEATMDLFYDFVCTDVEKRKVARRPYFDENFTLKFLHDMMTRGVSLLCLHPPSTMDQEWHGRSVTMMIQPGNNGTAKDIQPKLEWTTWSGGRENKKKTTSVSLLKIHAIKTALDEDMRGGNPDFDDFEANEECFFTITTDRGDVHVFETASTKQQEFVTRGLKNIIARLSFHLVAGDPRAATELHRSSLNYSPSRSSSSSPGELPSLPNPVQNMNRITHVLLDQ